MSQTERVAEVEALRQRVRAWKRAGERVALVPTMGALHAGHASLMRLARAHADRVVASIFVNPAQFGPNEDYGRYPRTEDADLDVLSAEGVELAYLPDAAGIYPEGFATSVHVAGLTEGLCGAFRPGHFDGVALVVAKLFLRAEPDVAIFGEKDWQQLQVIRRMAADLDIPVEIVGAPILREANGLALSSRNRYLTPEERMRAPLLYRTLTDVAAGTPAEQGIATLTQAGFKVDYLEVVDAQTLQPSTRPTRVLGAAWLGACRLIDNVPVA